MKIPKPNFVNKHYVFIAVFIIGVLVLQTLIMKFGKEYLDNLPMAGLLVPVVMAIIVGIVVAMLYKPAYAGLAFAVVLAIGLYSAYVEDMLKGILG